MSDETQSADSKPGKATAATEGAEPQDTLSGDNSISKDENLDRSEKKDGVDDSPQPFDEWKQNLILDTGDKEEDPQSGNEPLPQQKSTRIGQAGKQINTWYTRVVNGEADIEDETMPEWVRIRVKAMIDSELDKVGNVPVVDTAQEDLKETILNETRFERLIESLLNDILPSERKKLVNEAERLQDLGMDKLTAWSEAVNRLNVHKEAEERGAKAAMMHVPNGGIVVNERGKKNCQKAP